MDLQTLAKAFEDRVATHRTMRLSNLEDGKVTDNQDHSLGVCSGLKLAVGLFADVVRELLAPAATPAAPVDDSSDASDSTDTSSSAS